MTAADLEMIGGALKPFADIADVLVFTGAENAEGVELTGDALFDALMKVRAARDLVVKLQETVK